MPRIKLKPNSPEYEDRTEQPQTRCCDMPDCSKAGDHKAPRHRGLNEYYMFCAEHIRDYNRAWNFFDGMSNAEVQDHIVKSRYGFRPTWKYGADGGPEDILREKAWQTQHYTDEKPEQEKRKSYFSEQERSTPEFEALALMGLEPPVILSEIKKRYKDLAKKHHPDLNQGCQKSEELLKRINMAYTVLKLAYKGFEDLPEG